MWEVIPSYENGLIETLENSFGNLEIKNNLAEAIYSSSINLVEDNYQDYLVDLREVVENSSLQNVSEEELESLFKGILVNSISYMALNRCGIDPLEHFSYSDFEIIKQFDTKSVISRLGAATSDISEQVLREIASSVRTFERTTNNRNRTFVNNQKTNYYNNENKNNEGRNDYDEDRVQTNGDYQIPQVALPKIKQMPQGRFSRMREQYLKEHKKGLYEELMLDGKMEEHLGEIEAMAQKMMKEIIKSLAEKNKIDENLKATNQMEWVQEMNSIKNQAEEIVVTELIYN